jgi:hypothetical protein
METPAHLPSHPKALLMHGRKEFTGVCLHQRNKRCKQHFKQRCLISTKMMEPNSGSGVNIAIHYIYIYSASELTTVLRFQAYFVFPYVYSFRICYLAFLLLFLLNIRHNLPLPLKSLLQGLQNSVCQKHVHKQSGLEIS